MKYRISASILLATSLFACQYNGHKHIPLPEIRNILRPTDQEEYYCLLDACKAIKRMHVAIADVRMSIDDAVATAITLYLKNVDTVASLVLLKDLQNNKFEV